MKTNLTLLTALALTLPLAGAKAITFTSNTAIGVGNTTYDGQDIIVSGCTLTVDGPHAFASLLVTNSGAVTHSPAPNGETNNRLNLTIAGDATVDATSAIHADGRGYGSGRGPGTVPEQIYQGAGAGHGGNGGTSSSGWAGGGAYGSVFEPTTLGSGGGVGSGAPGGAGGGVIRLVVGGVLSVDGRLTANGANGSSGWYGGGGSGGSLWLTAGSFAGSGVISANGGQGFGTSNRAGGGGAGRIALYYGTNALTGSVAAVGGSGYGWGGAGTVYRKVTAEPLGEVFIDNGGAGGAYTPLIVSEPCHLTISNRAYVYPTVALSLGNLHVATNGILFQMTGQTGLVLTATGDATVDAGGVISASGAGYGSASGPGAGGSDIYQGGGAGHGGNGGVGSGGGRPGGPCYGSLLEPETPGSGGGTGSGAPGGAGGGTIRLNVVGTLRVDGQLTSNGADGSAGWYGGGGSGGSVWLTVGTLAGAGLISANGGQGLGTYNRAGGGGGGRLALYYGTSTFSGQVTALGANGYQRGGAGTVFRKPASESLGEVLIDNGDASGAVTALLACPEPFHLVIAHQASVYPTTPLTLGNFQVQDRGTLFQMGGGVSLDITCLGDAHIAATGQILADRTGYGAQSGPGAGYQAYSSACGAGHGGMGGQGQDWPPAMPGGPTYGSATMPTAPGSGGGNLYNGLGGEGGGAVRFTVSGVLNVDGRLSADGGDSQLNSSYRGGGGSGGSIWVTAAAVTGTGRISANGGSASYAYYANRSGGGGGGRIAIYTPSLATSIFTNLMVGGGMSWRNWGSPGSLYFSTNMLPLWVSSFSPTGTVRQAVGSVDVVFNQPVRSETFTPEDVLITVPSGEPPHGETTVTPLSAASFRIGFGTQAAVGNYLVQIGPRIENLYGQEMPEAYTGSFSITNPVISGFVKRTNGVALPNVLLSTGGALSTRTGTNGSYALTVPPSWSGTLTPSLAGWVFTPPSLSYVNLSDDATNQNFTANLAEAMILTTTSSGGTLNFRWPSAVGLSYQVQSATNLPATAWLNEGPPFPGTGGVLTTNVSIGPEPEKIFRLLNNN